uniref:D-inositol-3-phosphate glycosyltransferase n=1 Tax=Candidatus Methanophaga sp. ANME-1 ERB7 TaxID=2759913 RepID=A0A7G9Z4B5_9EURY|nr:D-inositol-3-phosphate glycosyltransferase [Methanosarcinales archaeon ANME-1 ERB7]QNO55099.1 D-inositol-3-phosphate glycosyltransferase [Methanosarcinales archaeon ANME-1 ERB7]
MKIAYIYDAVYPYVKGGAEKRVWEISKRLVKKGHEVHIFGMKYWNDEDVFVKDGVYLHGVCEPKELYVEGRRSIKEAIYFARKLLFPLMKEDFDVVDCQAFPYFSCFSAKICSSVKRTPLVITWHEIWDDYWYEYLGRKGVFGKWAEKMTTHLTDKMIAVSERTKKDLERIGVGVRKEIRIIPNGTDFGKIGRIKASDEESDVIFAGRLIKEKNVDVLIKTVNLVKKEIPDVKCVIIGDGPEKKELEKLAYDLGLENNLEFTGFLDDYDEVISYMKSSKVFVLPSTREGFGIVALEANACGLPVVTVDHRRNAACDFITNDENGFICELSEGDIGEKILTALDKREDMKRKCIENAKEYDWDELGDLLERFYKAWVTKI